MKICEGCGANLQPDALTCGFCGRVYEKQLQPTKVVCPVCHSEQKINKVASIYWAQSKAMTPKLGDPLENSKLVTAQPNGAKTG
jgi:ribosomal protein L40E